MSTLLLLWWYVSYMAAEAQLVLPLCGNYWTLPFTLFFFFNKPHQKNDKYGRLGLTYLGAGLTKSYQYWHISTCICRSAIAKVKQKSHVKQQPVVRPTCTVTEDLSVFLALREKYFSAIIICVHFHICLLIHRCMHMFIDFSTRTNLNTFEHIITQLQIF